MIWNIIRIVRRNFQEDTMYERNIPTYRKFYFRQEKNAARKFL